VTEYPGLNQDFEDLLRAFEQAEVEYVIVGAHSCFR